MDIAERQNPYEAAIKAAIEGNRAALWTAMPGEIVSFDAEAMTCEVQPTIEGVGTLPDGSTKALTMPLCLDCPVVFPSGGGVTLTFPLAEGDECLIVFASRCIDAWWQQGGVQPQAELRMHDLSDGFVIVGVRSQPNVLADVSTSAVELRSDDRETRFSLDPEAQTMAMVAPGGVTINGVQIAGDGTVTGPKEATFDGHSVGHHTHTQPPDSHGDAEQPTNTPTG